MPFRLVAACLPFLAGLIMSGMFLFRAQPVAALVPLLCGTIMGGAFWLGFFDSLGSETYKAAGSLATMVGLFAVFAYGSLFDTKLQQGYGAALMGFGHLEMYCPAATPNLRRIKDYGVAACAMQNNSDALSATAEFQKGIHFGPTLTLVDSAATLSQEKDVNHCARAFKIAEPLCPLAFSSLGKEERTALLVAAE